MEKVLVKFKERGPVEGFDDVYKTGIAGRRWALTFDSDIGLKKPSKFIAIELLHQIKYDGKWLYGSGYYSISLDSEWKVEVTQVQYDGYHNLICLGPLRISWLGWKERPKWWRD